MIWLFLVSLFGLLFSGVPVAIALLGSAAALLFVVGLYDHQTMAEYFINGANNFALMAIPFFILTGEIMKQGGVSQRIVDFAISLVGHIKGGLGYVVIISGLIFAGLSGSAVADTAALGAILIPMMMSKGYSAKSATGIVCAVGIVALAIPPSIPMIIFGVIGGVSITKMFIGGAPVGILMAIGLSAMWAYLYRGSDSLVFDREPWSERWKKFKDAFWALLLPVIIIVGLRGGIFTPTEAGVIAAIYAALISLFYRELKLNKLLDIFRSTVKTTGIVMFVASAAMVSGYAITVAQIPAELIQLLKSISDNGTVVLLTIMLFLLVVGCVMDLVPAILIFAPVLLPVVKSFGIDPVYFGVLMVINLSIGLITPPIGTVLYVGSSISKIKMGELTRGIWPFLAVHIAILFLLVFVPEIITLPIQWIG
ncbi:2,3-diketo-L-gulonate TRAP transporter large permease protein yiaN [Vibrio nigripulchritudo MADA3029]|uniref:TRAP transporter large permease protein n=2 Tax=Vibrio nigripulchritudo TaxID=28173 RepID=U4KF42_9VIBR|nr:MULTISPECIES: TRAP transporter large permease [Vibrio]EGU57659.1 integral membrane protein transporter [Vibrio nigripulchritudo ATCC 27043]UAB73143.1 TRAP transporter large permease [Vibrio sp. SCSIO 43132]CCN35758.1 2,3-diketo-L-gulonate TRAP transporter large permease protein yiaN [Vibrio nigripulchritudo AM115]CCN44683.1 2,3-diketo-L-gulonate TRAP transporter large permease protein yiaN [Vibrio nigripulchritudo FTn2]CCN48783.1 2,3-diketo-L-gulonate TRAP transporter large permease protein